MTTTYAANEPTAVAPPPGSSGHQQQPLFTCLSCSIAFLDAHDQRAHYRSDLHRYNMKRRVAGLPPVSADVFDAKVMERRAVLEESSGEAKTGKGKEEGWDRCEPCGKSFSSENVYRDHVNSKKHKENFIKYADNAERRQQQRTAAVQGTPPTAAPADVAVGPGEAQPGVQPPAPAPPASGSLSAGLQGLSISEDASPEEVQAAIDVRIAKATRIDVLGGECLFCVYKVKTETDKGKGKSKDVEPEDMDDRMKHIGSAVKKTEERTDDADVAAMESSSDAALGNGGDPEGQDRQVSIRMLADLLAHMSLSHGFFLPDAEYIVDLPGLLVYLAEKIAIGNVCLYCNGRRRGFNGLEAVRGHMKDKSHCKIAYDAEEDRFEVGDFYDFSSTYPIEEEDEEGGEWEDMDEDGDGEAWADADGDADEQMVNVEGSTSVLKATTSSRKAGGNNSNNAGTITYGDSELELVLPSGARIGHRSLRRYYAQNLVASDNRARLREEHQRSLAQRLLTEGSDSSAAGGGALVRSRGANGGDVGTMMRARNKGEAKEAERHVKAGTHLRKEQLFREKIAYRANNQKHFRDPLLQ